MIDITVTNVTGFEAAVHGMRNPLNSWDKSDSCYCGAKRYAMAGCSNMENYTVCDNGELGYCVGRNDLELMSRLIKSGPDHSKFLRFITVTFDCVAPLFWYKEFDTYKVGTVANSCSTMHTIHKRDLAKYDFTHDFLDDEGEQLLATTISVINNNRAKYLETKDPIYWRRMIELLPSSYNQRRTIQLNYAVLRNIYKARRGHKLAEWRAFCSWIENLPYSKELICE